MIKNRNWWCVELFIFNINKKYIFFWLIQEVCNKDKSGFLFFLLSQHVYKVIFINKGDL